MEKFFSSRIWNSKPERKPAVKMGIICIFPLLVILSPMLNINGRGVLFGYLFCFMVPTKYIWYTALFLEIWEFVAKTSPIPHLEYFYRALRTLLEPNAHARDKPHTLAADWNKVTPIGSPCTEHTSTPQSCVSSGFDQERTLFCPLK